jgi:hypothetical protein
MKWLVGTLPGRKGRFRNSAKTTSLEQAEGIVRQYEIAAAGGKDMEAAMSLPTVKDAVDARMTGNPYLTVCCIQIARLGCTGRQDFIVSVAG